MREFTLKGESSEKPSRTGEILKALNPSQSEAATHSDGPLLIIAGAGSGKTRVLTFRIAWMLEQNIAKPWQILALTFTNKAANEMRERIEKLIGDEAERIWMGTFHSIFARILRFEADKIGYTSDFSIYDSEDSGKLVRNILKELNYDTKEVRPKSIQFLISKAKNSLIPPEAFGNKFFEGPLDDIAKQVYPIYENRLKMSNALDFDDLLIKPIELFEQHKDVLEAYQDRFQYLLIDEYQDTNRAQYKVAKLLAAKHHNICVVGDDAQSIYSFRGADISNILSFEEDYPEAKRVALEQNYRSTKAILMAADSVIKNNQNRLDKTLWTENDFGETITVLESYNERDEANRISHFIQNLKLRKGYSYHDFAILYRTNSQSRVFEDALRHKGIPYQLVGGISFYQRKEIKDVVSYLKLLVNPNDEEALLRVINEPSRGIGAKTMSTILEVAHADNKRPWEVLKEIDKINVYKPAQNQIRDFMSLIEEARKRLGSEPMVDTAQFLMKQTGYLQQFIQENTHEALSRRENVLELFNALSYHEKTKEDATLSTFLQEISLITDLDNFDLQEPSVTLMTVHGSKGLEFPVVFIAGLEDELFPIGARNNDDVDMEEERRLFYVAITRAQKELYLSHARTRFKFGDDIAMKRSRFLSEIDPAVLRTETGATYSGSSSRDYGVRRSGSWRSTKTLGSASRPSITRAKKTTHSGMNIDYDNITHDDLRVGTKVMHEKFGKGKIISKEGFADQTKVVVFFNDYGQKKLLLKFARLSILD